MESMMGRGVLLLFLWLLSFNALAGMGVDDARQLLDRTGFGATPAEIQTFAALSRSQGVDRILDGAVTRANTPIPAWGEEFMSLRGLRDLSEEERKAAVRDLFTKGIELRSWWYTEMLSTSSPFTERMTLFWHNHFVSSQQKVKSPQMMLWQNELLRRNALGNFGTLLHEIAKDPAMIVYLDSASNRKGQPNENFARELMELFTLGEGNYSEQDVREAARAFTGWSLDRDTGKFRFYPRLHDDGVKTVLGRTGNLDGDQVLDILLAQPQTAERIVAKLWREFVSPNPDPKEVTRLAGVFRSGHYEIKPLMRAMLLSDAFYATHNRGSLVKSPVDLLVGTVREFSVQGLDPRLLVLAGRQLGQDIFGPPNVKGWSGGDEWINSSSLLARKQILARLFRAEEMPSVGSNSGIAKEPTKDGSGKMLTMQPIRNIYFDPNRLFEEVPGTELQRQQFVERVMLPLPPTAAMGLPMDRMGLLRQAVLDPVYQLK
jgi:uncharacterized protein (DUF1800 family)